MRLLIAALFLFFQVYACQAYTLRMDPNGEFVLKSGQRLMPGDIAVAQSYQYNQAGTQITNTRTVANLAMQTDGNLVLSTYDPNFTVLRIRWTSNTAGNPGAYLEMQPDGNLVVYRSDRYPLWASNTNGYGPSAFARLQSDGNFVVYSRAALWASNTNQPPYGGGFADPVPIRSISVGQTYYDPSGYFSLTLQSDRNLVLSRYPGVVLWATGGRGERAVVQTDGNFVLYDSFNNANWASNTDGYGPGVELLLQTDGNLVLYGNRARWSPASELPWYQRLCAVIECRYDYRVVFGDGGGVGAAGAPGGGGSSPGGGSAPGGGGGGGNTHQL
jgi:uncharacterized membrane protein YgcG